MERIDYIIKSRVAPPSPGVLWLNSVDNKLYALYSNLGWMSVSGDGIPFSTKRGVDTYLYEISYDNIDYNYARKYFKDNGTVTLGGCSSFANSNFLASNFDWYYSNSVDFVVRTPAYKDRYAVLGVAGNVDGLTLSTVNDNYSDQYRLLPFKLLRGVNECGLCCAINVVPTDKGITTKTTPLLEQRDSISMSMLVRYILDKFSSATEAINYIKNYVELYQSKAMQSKGYDTHFLISDSTSSYVLEVINNEIVTTEHSIMTNFHISGVEFNQDGTVYTPADSPAKLPSVENKITDYGAGLERYNIIVDALTDSSSISNAKTILSSLLYTNAYKDSTSPFWYSEFVGKYGSLDLTVDSQVTAFTPVVNAAKELFNNRDRSNPDTWQTNTSVIIDKLTNDLYVASQENTSRWYKFRF